MEGGQGSLVAGLGGGEEIRALEAKVVGRSDTGVCAGFVASEEKGGAF